MAPSGSFVVFATLLALSYALPGGFNDVDLNDEDLLRLAQSATTKINAKSNSMYAQKLIKVTDAKVQVGCCLFTSQDCHLEGFLSFIFYMCSFISRTNYVPDISNCV